MKILNRQPVPNKEEHLTLPDGSHLLVKPYQVVVWVRLDLHSRVTNAIPAFLDTGHNHNFSISEEHLLRWCNLPAEAIRSSSGRVYFKGEVIPLRSAYVLLHHNVKGTNTLHPDKIFRLPVSEDSGIAIHKIWAPRLPILGVRPLLRNKLRLILMGRRNRFP